MQTLTILPIEVAELVKQVSDVKQTEVQEVLQQIFTGTAEWQQQVDSIDVKGIEDKMSITLAETARKNIKDARLKAEKLFDTKRQQVQVLKAEFDMEDKLWLKAKQVMQIKFKAIEEVAEWKANFVKRFEAEQKELRTQKRINEVVKYAPQMNRSEFDLMSDASFDAFLSGIKSAYKAKIEAAAKAEQDRIEAEQLAAEAEAQRKADEAARIEAQRIENEKLKAEREEQERLFVAERAAAAAERAAAEQKLLEAQRIIEAERKAAEAAAAEAKQKIADNAAAIAQKIIEEERKAAEAEAQRLSKLEAAAAAPDKEKLLELATSFANIALPSLTTANAQKIIADIEGLQSKIVAFINQKANKL